MTRYAILCGSAPDDYRQKKLEDFHDSLENSGAYEPGNIIVFPNGVNELFLESFLNEVFDKICDADDIEDSVIGGIVLYLCARSEKNLNAELGESCTAGVEVVRFGNDEVRKDVIAYYIDLAEKCGIEMRVVYEFDDVLLSEESLGWEKIG